MKYKISTEACKDAKVQWEETCISSPLAPPPNGLNYNCEKGCSDWKYETMYLINMEHEMTCMLMMVRAKAAFAQL